MRGIGAQANPKVVDSTIVKSFTVSEHDSNADIETARIKAAENEGQSGTMAERIRKEIQSLEKELSDNPENNLILLDKKFQLFSTFLQETSGEVPKRLRRNFGETSEKLRRAFGDKLALLLFVIAINSRISAKEASKYLGVSSRTVETYISKLKEQGVIERIGPDYGGEWLIK